MTQARFGRYFVICACVALPLVALSVVAQFGSQTTGPQAYSGAPSIAFSLNEADFGVAGDVTDNCLLLDTGQAASAGAQNFDIRGTPCHGKPAGSLLGDADTVEKGNGYPQVSGAGAEEVHYGDANSNGRYDFGDYVYVRSTPGGGLLASAATGTWTLRLTPTGPDHGSFSAGTLVLAGDSDFLAFGLTAPVLAPVSVAWFDTDTSVAFSPPDTAYLMPMAVGTPAMTIIPSASIRLNAPALSPPASATPSTTPASATSAASSSSTTVAQSTTTAESASTSPQPDPSGSATASSTLAPTASDDGKKGGSAMVGALLAGLAGVALTLRRRLSS